MGKRKALEFVSRWTEERTDKNLELQARYDDLKNITRKFIERWGYIELSSYKDEDVDYLIYRARKNLGYIDLPEWGTDEYKRVSWELHRKGW